MTDHIFQVGAPDPELKSSPIFDEEDGQSLDLELESGVAISTTSRTGSGSTC